MEKLKLRAQDGEDLQAIAILLQDAIVPACDIAYQPENQSFIMAAQRFLWDEKAQDAELPYKRICSAVTISGVTHVQFKGMNPRDPAALFDLLTLTLKDDSIYLVFAAKGEIRLDIEKWELFFEDFGETWPVKIKPTH